MTDFRALCAELLNWIERASQAHVYGTQDLITRARAALAQPEGEGPSDQELASFLVDRHRERMESESAFGCPDFDGAKARAARIADARAVLSRWGRPAAPAVEPIPVSERLPEDADCLVITAYDGTSSFDEYYCYLAKEFRHCGRVLLIWELKPTSALKLDLPFMYWRPASTRFLPTTVDPAQPT
jgi:hypothetical protein